MLTTNDDSAPGSANLQTLIADLTARLARSQQDYQRILHERDRLLETLSQRAVEHRVEPWGLQVFCDSPTCATPPLRIRLCPPEDAIPGWVRGMGWQVDGDRYRCRLHTYPTSAAIHPPAPKCPACGATDGCGYDCGWCK